MGMLEQVFGGRMPFLTPSKLGSGKRRWNLETSSVLVEFPPPYRNSIKISPSVDRWQLQQRHCTCYHVCCQQQEGQQLSGDGSDLGEDILDFMKTFNGVNISVNYSAEVRHAFGVFGLFPWTINSKLNATIFKTLNFKYIIFTRFKIWE